MWGVAAMISSRYLPAVFKVGVRKELFFEREGTHFSSFLTAVTAKDFSSLLMDTSRFLSKSEEAYFTRLKAEPRRQSFLMGRYTAKWALEGLIQESDARMIEIKSGVFGYPLVCYPSTETPNVSISHSDGIAVAISYPWDHVIGIDIETINLDRLQTIQSQLSPNELNWSRSQGEGATGEINACTLLWTAKEALSKAVKSGLMTPFTIYETREFQRVEPNVWQGQFTNFGQYKVIGWVGKQYAMSIVLPKKTMWPDGCRQGLNFLNATDEFGRD
jgi:4'-phosphopantetheinyl transferase